MVRLQLHLVVAPLVQLRLHHERPQEIGGLGGVGQGLVDLLSSQGARASAGLVEAGAELLARGRERDRVAAEGCEVGGLGIGELVEREEGRGLSKASRERERDATSSTIFIIISRRISLYFLPPKLSEAAPDHHLSHPERQRGAGCGRRPGKAQGWSLLSFSSFSTSRKK